MSGNAWVVTVSRDDLTDCAVLSGRTLRQTGTSAAVVAVISTTVSKKQIHKCQGIFDTIVFANKTLANDNNLLLYSAQELQQYSKLLVVRAGTLVLGHLDFLFDGDNLSGACVHILKTDKSGHEWRLARVTPGYWKNNQPNSSQLTFCEWAKLIFKTEQMNFFPTPTAHFTSAAGLDRYLENALAHVIVDDSSKQTNNTLETMTENLKDLQDSIAIVGMSCRFPGANSPDEYWEILKHGRNTCSKPPSHRLSLVDLDPEVKANFLKCPVDLFDAAFFGISPKEACLTDPQARLLLEVSWEALEDAAVNPADLKGTKTGVFLGSWLQDYKHVMNRNQRMSETEGFFREYLGNGFGSTAAKLSFFYGFKGPNIFTDSACSSSMAAVDMAIKSLQRQECPLALACGTNLILQTNRQPKVLAPDGISKAFDALADGYGRAEGIAVLVLKRYSDALQDQDDIHGVILGAGISQEGLSKSFGTPTVESQACAMQKALAAANMSPSQIDYLEAHATGTAVGDPIEAAAIIKAYGQDERETPLWINSGKTNIGHTESCSGIAGIIKVLLAMKHKVIPGHINMKRQNPKIDFSSIPGSIPLTNMEWPRNEERPRRAAVSSFGITGTNVHVIIQEAHVKSLASSDLSPCNPENHLLTLSAKSMVAPEEMKDLFCTFLECSQDSLERIAYSANVHRPHHKFRRAYLATSKMEMAMNMKRSNFISSSSGHCATRRLANICFTFPGRVSQTDRTCILNLYNGNQLFRETMNHCREIFCDVTGYSTPIMSILLSTEETENSSDMGAEIHFCLRISLQYSIAKLWMLWGIEPSLVMGHCAGEFSAAVISGILTLEDAFKMGKIMPLFRGYHREQSTSVLALQCNHRTVEKLIQKFVDKNNSSVWLDVSSVNSGNQILVTGPVEGIIGFKQFCNRNNIYSKILSFPYCFHSRAVEPAREKCLQILSKISPGPMKMPFVSSVTGKMLVEADLDDGKYWFRVLRDCVNFEEACGTAVREMSPDIYIEIGMGNVLTKLTHNNVANTEKPEALCVDTFPKPGILFTLGKLYTFGANINWKGVHGNENRARVKLPHYPFQRKSFWFEAGHGKQVTASMSNPMGKPPSSESFGHGVLPLYQEIWKPARSCQEICKEMDHSMRSRNASKQTNWILFKIGGGENGIEEFRQSMEKDVGRNVFVWDVYSLEESQLNKFFSSVFGRFHESLEGMVIWLAENTMELSTSEFDDSPNFRKTLEPLLYTLKYLTKLTNPPRVVLITRGCWESNHCGLGATSSQAWSLLRSIRLELPKIRCTSIDLEYGHDTPPTALIDQVKMNLWLDDDEAEVKYVGGVRHVRRLEEISGSTLSANPDGSQHNAQLLFNDTSTYLITGGMGAIGFAVCKWMIIQGAKYVVLVGRSEANNETKEEIVKLTRDYKAVIVCKQLDISDYQQCKKLIKEELDNDEWPPLRGIHHCAGILSDKLIATQDWENFDKVLKPKAVGAWNLHQITLDMPLQFFVLYSSISATFGMMGVSNYACANAYLDSLAQFRHSKNLPCVSVNWGGWKAGFGESIKNDWVVLFSVKSGISTLEQIMRKYQHRSNLIAGKFDISAMLRSMPHWKKFLEDICPFRNVPCSPSSRFNSNNENNMSGALFAGKYMQLEDHHKKLELVKVFVLRVICDTMGTLEQDISDNVPLSELGMDSLMAMQFTGKLTALIQDIIFNIGVNKEEGMKLVEIDLQENGTLTKLTSFVLSILQNPETQLELSM